MASSQHEEAEERRRRKEAKKGQAGGKETPVMDGQSCEERREIREELRKLLDEISKKNRVLEKVESEALLDMMEKNDEIFEKVKYVREGVLDGAVLERLTLVVLKQAKAMASSVQRYDYTQFIKSVQDNRVFGGRSGVDWLKLGAAVSSCFQCVPEINFMLGPLDKPDHQRKERKKRQRQEDDEEAEEVQPEQAGKSRDKTEEETSKRVGKMKRMIEESLETEEGGSGSGKPKEVDVFRLCFNPESFTQTVENIFDLSFQAKERHAQFVMNKEGVPVVKRIKKDDVNNMAPERNKQAVLSLTMKDWQDLCEAYEVEECMIQNRGGYTKDATVERMMRDHPGGSQASSSSSS